MESIMLRSLFVSLVLLVGSSSFSPFSAHQTLTQRHSSITTITTPSRTTATTTTQVFLFNFGDGTGNIAKIPSSTNDRDNQAIRAIQAAIQKPRNPTNPLIECEFPALAALNKLGDGSLRSALEAEDANVAFVQKLVKGLAPVSFLGIGPKISLVVGSAASNSFVAKVRKIQGQGANIYLLRDGVPNVGKEDVCIFVTPSSRSDYEAAKSLARSCTVLVVNGFAKDQKSIPGSATMAYFLKPLTYNSQVAGFLIRSYPSSWTVLDAVTKEVLGSFSDDEILVQKTNTPDLRTSGRLVQRSVDERAIRARGDT